MPGFATWFTRGLAAAAALPLAASATPPDAAKEVPAITMFRFVCLSDRVVLPPNSAVDQPYDKLPPGARDALGFAFPDGDAPHVTAPPAFALPAGEVPNRILARLPDKRWFLLLPAAGKGRYAASCAMVWRGGDYPAALAVAKELALDPVPANMPPLTGVPGLNYAVIRGKGMVVGAAELAGWTVLRIAADTTPDTAVKP